MSSSYERMNYLTSFGFSIRWRTQFISNFKSTKQEVQIIDFLSGMGETWKATKTKFPNFKLTVVDFSEGMLQYARKKNQQQYGGQVNILQQDILNNQLPDNSFDFVTCAFGLKTFNNNQLNILASETKRILKNEGQFSFIEVSIPNNKILHLLYRFYLGKIIPILGRMLLGNPSEYKMLWKYTSNFKNSKNAAKIFSNMGLDVEFKSYFFGCSTGFIGRKRKI